MLARHSPRWWRSLFVATATLACLATAAPAADLRDENAVRAAFVFNLTKYVEWPANSNNLRICFLGDSAMGAVLKSTLQGKTSDNRLIEVSLEAGDEPPDRCDVVYISYRSTERARAVLLRLKSRNVLTVGDSESFAESGGMVGLVTQNEHIKLQVNLQAVQLAQLKISSRVLALATIVNPAGGAK